MTDMTTEQFAAALDEQVYRRSGTEQQLQDSDIGVTSVDWSASSSIPSFFSYDNGYFYNNSTGFVGRIVEGNGKVFVVFRGSDLSGSFLEDGLPADYRAVIPMLCVARLTEFAGMR